MAVGTGVRWGSMEERTVASLVWAFLIAMRSGGDPVGLGIRLAWDAHVSSFLRRENIDLVRSRAHFQFAGESADVSNLGTAGKHGPIYLQFRTDYSILHGGKEANSHSPCFSFARFVGSGSADISGM